jgi:hypothetical protein
LRHRVDPFLSRYNWNRDALAVKLNTRRPPTGKEYYSFVPSRGWRFIILDPFQEAIIGSVSSVRNQFE